MNSVKGNNNKVVNKNTAGSHLLVSEHTFSTMKPVVIEVRVCVYTGLYGNRQTFKYAATHLHVVPS